MRSTSASPIGVKTPHVPKRTPAATHRTIEALEKENAVLRAENRILRSTDRAHILAPIAINLIRWGGLCAIAYFGYAAISSLAGKTTISDIMVNILSNVVISNGLAWVLAGGGVAYGWRERRLRQRAIQRLGGRIPELETNIDPGRTSSTLDSRGETNPEDRE